MASLVQSRLRVELIADFEIRFQQLSPPLAPASIYPQPRPQEGINLFMALMDLLLENA